MPFANTTTARSKRQVEVISFVVDILCIYVVSVVAMSLSLWTKGDHTMNFCWITSLETETKYILRRLIGSERKDCYNYHVHFTIFLTLRGSITPKTD